MKPAVGNVPQEQNVIIPPHIRDSTDRYQFTFGSIVSPESCGEESLSPEDLDPPPTLPKISDEFFPSFPVGFLKRMGHDFIYVDGVPGLSVEQHDKNFSYKSEHIQNALRHLIHTPIQLECAGIPYANLIELVCVDLLPKFISIPAANHDTYETYRDNVKRQCQQICEAPDQIVGAQDAKTKDYHIFRKRLLSSQQTLPKNMEEDQRKPTRSDLHEVCRRILVVWQSAASISQQTSWKNVLQESGNKNLKKMLNTRIHNQVKVDYDNSSSSNHTYVRNSLTHINDHQVLYTALEDMHKDLEQVFPLYSLECWEFMHKKSLNAQFGPEEYAYFFLNCVTKRFYFAPLLKACRMCLSMTAKFQNSYERPFPFPLAFRPEFEVATSELEYCIKGLLNSNEEYHRCVSLKTKRNQMTGLDKLVFKSVRIIVFALYFLSIIKTKRVGVGDVIFYAFHRTSNLLAAYSSQTFHLRNLDVEEAWPSINAVCKITGLHFIIAKEAIQSFWDKILEEIKKLLHMLEG
ncbi:hypothetical protein POM88_051424 [Heracleum sosnowskyi]|uniref:Uncharacterized protein n=1 Tax=Heracleum sosnowskyi TaxID=360622 RepID=A0AAD8H1V2_9APIA|nr:hypothetical protein POM88_051424 [Heracleum sosnowskyi]